MENKNVVAVFLIIVMVVFARYSGWLCGVAYHGFMGGVGKAENDMRRLRTDAERWQRKMRERQWTE